MKEAIPQIQAIDSDPTKQEHKESSDVLLKELVEMRSELLKYIENTFCKNSRNPRQEAEDIVQIAMMKASKSIHTFRGESSLRTWVHTIASNEANAYYRSRQVTRLGDRNPNKTVNFEEYNAKKPGQEPDPEAVTYGNEIRDIVDKFLGFRYDPREIEMFNLNINEGLSYTEIGERFGTSVGTIKSTMGRMKREIKKYLEDKHRIHI
jgi:RNA polymerase sigma-70 factor, ECF subfamily